MPEVVPNIAIKIEYDGALFHGWQRQPGKPSVQAHIEDALEHILKRRVVIYGASRTDSGVHAMGQVANFWGESRFKEEEWARVLNTLLPKEIRVVASKYMPATFHAQKRAVGKKYLYRVLNRKTPSALDRRVHFHPRPVDWDRVRKALPYFLGEHDFKAFKGARSSVVSTVRTIHSFTLHEEPNHIYRFEIEGNGFLKQMVRAIVGTVIQVGEGKREPGDIPGIIASRDRRMAGYTVPGDGLCLWKVYYPDEFEPFPETLH